MQCKTFHETLKFMKYLLQSPHTPDCGAVDFIFGFRLRDPALLLVT